MAVDLPFFAHHPPGCGMCARKCSTWSCRYRRKARWRWGWSLQLRRNTNSRSVSGFWNRKNLRAHLYVVVSWTILNCIQNEIEFWWGEKKIWSVTYLNNSILRTDKYIPTKSVQNLFIFGYFLGVLSQFNGQDTDCQNIPCCRDDRFGDYVPANDQLREEIRMRGSCLITESDFENSFPIINLKSWGIYKYRDRQGIF